MVMCDASAELGQQTRGEDSVVGDSAAIVFQYAPALEAAVAGRRPSAGHAEDRRLVGDRPREAETTAEAVLVRDVVVHLDVDRITVLRKRN